MSPRPFRIAIWSLIEMGCLLYLIALYKKRPALVRWSSGSVAGSVGAKVRLFIESTKYFWGNCCYRFVFTVKLTKSGQKSSVFDSLVRRNITRITEYPTIFTDGGASYGNSS